MPLPAVTVAAGYVDVEFDLAQRLVELPVLSDETMVNEQRTHMFDASAPNPSIETLLHAFLPQRFVDHTHADAILALTNHPEGEDYVRAALGDDILIVPYVKPGFDLARLCAERFRAFPDCAAMVLMQHGLFTWGNTAKDCYDTTLRIINKAAVWLERIDATNLDCRLWPRAGAVGDAKRTLGTLRSVPAAKFSWEFFKLLAIIECRQGAWGPWATLSPRRGPSPHTHHPHSPLPSPAHSCRAAPVHAPPPW